MNIKYEIWEFFDSLIKGGAEIKKIGRDENGHPLEYHIKAERPRPFEIVFTAKSLLETSADWIMHEVSVAVKENKIKFWTSATE